MTVAVFSPKAGWGGHPLPEAVQDWSRYISKFSTAYWILWRYYVYIICQITNKTF